MWEDKQWMDFFIGGRIIMDWDWNFVQKLEILTLKHFTDEIVFYKHAAFQFTRLLLMDWSGVNYCDAFISCLDGTYSLQRIIWWASDVMQNFSKTVTLKKQIYIIYIYILSGQRVSKIPHSTLEHLKR